MFTFTAVLNLFCQNKTMFWQNIEFTIGYNKDLMQIRPLWLKVEMQTPYFDDLIAVKFFTLTGSRLEISFCELIFYSWTRTDEIVRNFDCWVLIPRLRCITTRAAESEVPSSDSDSWQFQVSDSDSNSDSDSGPTPTFSCISYLKW